MAVALDYKRMHGDMYEAWNATMKDVVDRNFVIAQILEFLNDDTLTRLTESVAQSHGEHSPIHPEDILQGMPCGLPTCDAIRDALHAEWKRRAA